MRKKVKENSNFIRDEKTKAILNTNFLEYQNYLNLKRSKQNGTRKIENLEQEMGEIKNSIDELKNMLSTILNNIDT